MLVQQQFIICVSEEAPHVEMVILGGIKTLKSFIDDILDIIEFLIQIISKLKLYLFKLVLFIVSCHLTHKSIGLLFFALSIVDCFL